MVESVKAASEVFAPVAGEVVAVNEALADEPAKVNESPEGAGWFLKLKPANPGDLDALMDETAYKAFPRNALSIMRGNTYTATISWRNDPTISPAAAIRAATSGASTAARSAGDRLAHVVPARCPSRRRSTRRRRSSPRSPPATC